MEGNKFRRIAAIMFTDIIGYTALMERDEKEASLVRNRHREVFQQQHVIHHGEILEYYGDGTLSIFQSGVAAVDCALAIQRALRKGKTVPLRIGLDMGDIVFNETEVYGNGVNLASRIESLGVEGTILISKKLNDELKNHKQLSTVSMGHFEFKNIKDPVEVFAVNDADITLPDRSMLQGKRSTPATSIAVLPFVNMAGREDEYFSDGITEEIINALSNIEGLKVTARTSSFAYKGENQDVRKIGHALNVKTILEGSIRKSKNKVRVTAQLIDVENGYHLWAANYDKELHDIFIIQDEISTLIAERLREHLGHFQFRDKKSDSVTQNIGAYELYLKGRYHLHIANMVEIEKAISLFHETLSLDPNFALAWSGLNNCYAVLGAIGFMDPEMAFKKAKEYAQKAFDLNPELPEVHYSFAMISLWHEWDFKASFHHLRKALEIRPGYADAYDLLAIALALAGKLEAGLRNIEIALDLDPFSLMAHNHKSLILFFLKRYDEALKYCDMALSLRQHYRMALINKGFYLTKLRQFSQALETFSQIPSNMGDDVSQNGGMAFVYACSGKREKTKELLPSIELHLSGNQAALTHFYLIIIEAALGNLDRAMDMLNEGVSQKNGRIIFMKVSPLLDPLRHLDSFKALESKYFGPDVLGDTSDRRKYTQSKLSLEEARLYINQLTQFVIQDKLYLNNKLTLRDLAEHLRISPNTLSQVLNEFLGKNFSEFINRYRINHFKSLVQDASNSHLTFLALAYDSGFNSKTVFNSVFKKFMGITPKQYVKSLSS